MARPRKKLKILLIEPNYSNKYPPIGLMKLSTYHKMLGHEVVFYKGDLKQFVIERIANKCIDEFYKDTPKEGYICLLYTSPSPRDRG